MFGIKSIVKRHIIEDMVRGVRSTNEITQKIMVVDHHSLRIMDSAVKMNELLDENIIVIEPLEKRRQPYHSMDAIYFVQPTADVIARIIEDFSRNKYNKDGHVYAAVHLFFTSSLDDDLFHKLKTSQASRYIRTLKEFYLDFLAVESQCFVLERPWSMVAMFGAEVHTELVLREYSKIASQIASFCITLGEFPYIRHAALNSGFDRISAKLSTLVYDELDRYAKLDADFPKENTSQRATLLIVDRSIDPTAPLLHEFTYQAMANDLLDISENGTRYKYGYMAGSERKDKEIVLDEVSDPVWTSIRHTHIAECINYVINNFNKFLSENRAAAGLVKGRGGDEKSGVASLAQLKETLSSVPQFQELKAKFSVHINMAQECMNLFEKYKLAEVAGVEQDLATGETVDGDSLKNIEVAMIPLLDEKSVPLEDKVRLLMLYIIGKDGVRDDDRRRLLEHAQVSSAQIAAITNLSLLGVKLTKQKSQRRSKSRTRQGKKRADDVSYDLSRYVPALKFTVQDLAEGKLPKETYPFNRDPAASNTYGVGNSTRKLNRAASSGNLGAGGTSSANTSAPPATTATSLRTTKPSWHKKGGSDASAGITLSDQKLAVEERKKSGRLIVFVAGGVTFSEIRSMYELGNALKKDIIVGSTHIITPRTFLEDLQKLRQPLVIPEEPKIKLLDASEKGGKTMNQVDAKKSGFLSGLFRREK